MTIDLQALIDNKRRIWRYALVGILSLLIVISVVYLIIGAITINPLTAGHFEQQLLWELRLPRLLCAMIIGAALAASGATLQVLLGNVLAEPGIIGISGGASVAMVVLMFFVPQFATPFGYMSSAMVGALVFTLLFTSIAKRLRLPTTKMLLVGVALGILCGAAVTWAFYFSDDLSLRQLMYWLMGSIGGATWAQLTIIVITLPTLVWLLCQGSLLDRLSMGEVHARQMGLNVHTIRLRLIFAIAVLVGSSVALGGVISFVGLVVPHLIRLTLGSTNRFLLPMSALLGAFMIVCADMVARIALDAAELPLGVVTTTIGAPIFIWMLLKQHDSR